MISPTIVAKPSNDLISEMCIKYNVSEKTIRRIGEFTKSK